MKTMRRAVRIGRERESAPLAPPALGEHTEPLLREFGFDAPEVPALRNAGVV